MPTVVVSCAWFTVDVLWRYPAVNRVAIEAGCAAALCSAAMHLGARTSAVVVAGAHALLCLAQTPSASPHDVSHVLPASQALSRGTLSLVGEAWEQRWPACDAERGTNVRAMADGSGEHSLLSVLVACLRMLQHNECACTVILLALKAIVTAGTDNVMSSTISNAELLASLPALFTTVSRGGSTVVARTCEDVLAALNVSATAT